MKKLIFVVIALIITISANCQKIKKDANGNYYATTTEQTETAKNTGKTYTTAKGEVYSVYISAKGKLFVIRTSKNGNQYKQYLKP